MSQRLKKKFTITFEIEAKNDLSEIEALAGIKGTLGSFQIGSRIPSIFRRVSDKKRYITSRLSLSSQAPANAGLQRVAESLLKKLDVERFQRIKDQLSECQFYLRVGVFYVEHPPRLLLPTEIMTLAIKTGALLSVDYYQCSTLVMSSTDRLARARFLRSLKLEKERL